MAIICRKIHSSDKFSYHAETRTFTAEVSDLGLGEAFVRIYDDAADEGFGIRSKKTGKVMYFAVGLVNRNSDGDVASWDLFPIDRKDVNLCKVTVFND